MLFRFFILLMPFFFLSFTSTSQIIEQQTSPNSKVGLELEGMLGLAVGKDFYAVNIGGPTLFFIINPNLKMGFGAFPSFYFLNGRPGARLGVAPRIDYKQLAFFAPFYHRDSADEWIWSVGMGYKFHRRNPGK
jgi:hypothetical protein